MAGWLEQLLGAVLIVLTLLDVFLTVLYARAGTGIFAPRLGRWTWRIFGVVARSLPGRDGVVLSFCGPSILVVLVFAWSVLLATGAGLIVHPALGIAVRPSTGRASTDFVTALLVGGASMSVVGTSDYSPQTAAYKLVFIFNSLVGASALSLTLTYLMQVYSALRNRNTTGLHLDLQSAGTGDAAELIARWGPRGEFNGGYNNLSTLAASMTEVKEVHHFYPVLFYFRFEQPAYAVSRMALVSLDAVTLIESGLDEERYAWLRESAAVIQLRDACIVLLKTLHRTFLPNASFRHGEVAGSGWEAQWRSRYAAGLDRLRAAGIETRADPEAGAREYVRLRREWDREIQVLAPALAYQRDQVDPAGSGRT